MKNTMNHFQFVHSEEQVAAVVRLAHEIWQEHYVPIIGQKQVDYMVAKFQSAHSIIAQLSDTYEYYLVSHQGQDLGYVAIVPDRTGPTLMLSKIYILKSARGLGLEKQTLYFVEDLYFQRGINQIWLSVNKYGLDAIAWYARMGFRNAGPTRQGIGEGFVMDDFRLVKTITIPVSVRDAP
ncbi:MAG: GNAT family N-acetyltransferase [Desulfobulbaceae bacterium]|nr:GNAT family N-acetyltransferase [Desulfobulbaceae bacterium]MDP2106094.1 GNAT family N-acetyltransferase [Desulfobulbaceae bacterium]